MSPGALRPGRPWARRHAEAGEGGASGLSLSVWAPLSPSSLGRALQAPGSGVHVMSLRPRSDPASWQSGKPGRAGPGAVSLVAGPRTRQSLRSSPSVWAQQWPPPRCWVPAADAPEAPCPMAARLEACDGLAPTGTVVLMPGLRVWHRLPTVQASLLLCRHCVTRGRYLRQSPCPAPLKARAAAFCHPAWCSAEMRIIVTAPQ